MWKSPTRTPGKKENCKSVPCIVFPVDDKYDERKQVTCGACGRTLDERCEALCDSIDKAIGVRFVCAKCRKVLGGREKVKIFTDKYNVLHLKLEVILLCGSWLVI